MRFQNAIFVAEIFSDFVDERQWCSSILTMKRKDIDKNTKVSGFYISELVRGFFGEQDEGKKMLALMGLPSERIPFSAASFLLNKQARWADVAGNVAIISFKIHEDQIECFGSYMEQKKSHRMFTEWCMEDDDEMIVRLMSEAIGDLCMKCIYEIMTN